MADSKISDLPAVVTPASTDEFAVNQSGTTKKITLDQVSSTGISGKREIPTAFTSAAINQAIDKQRFQGSTRYLDYNMQELKQHLEKLFEEGMTWKNKGRHGWTIDHIIPLKYKKEDSTYYWNQKELADPTSETFKKAWSLDNLQPMWASENFSKGNRRI